MSIFNVGDSQPGAPSSTITAPANQAQWAVMLCDAMGWPASTSNITAIIAWALREGGHFNNSAKFNPLNTTQPFNGSTGMNSVHVQSYASWADGLAATVQTLKNGHYGDILTAFQSGDAMSQLAHASAGLTTWSGSGYGGISGLYGTAAKMIGQSGAADTSATSTTGSGGGTVGTATAAAKSVTEMVQDQFGYMAWALAIPELKTALENAVAQHLNPAQFQSALEATTWWQQHSSVARQWAQLSLTDPATAQRETSQKVNAITVLAQRLGIGIDPTRLQALATDALSLGWDDSELNQAVIAEGNFSSQVAANQAGKGGDISSIMSELKAQAAQYYLPLDDASAYNWATQMLKLGEDPSSTTANGGFTAYLQNMAIQKYPYLTKQIQGGMTPATYFQPYKAQAAGLLEVSPDSVDIMNDPTYQKMADFTDPNGVHRAMTLTEAGTYTRGLPSWQNTANANSDTGKMALSLLNEFGAVKTS